MKQALAWICAAAVLAGCGQKGPLYLPDKNASVVTRPAPTPAAPPATPNGAAPQAKDKDDDSKSQDQSPQK